MHTGFPGGSAVKNLHGNPLQYFCLGNPWTEEPSQPQCIEPQKVRDNLGTEFARSLYTCFHLFL